MNNQLGGYEWGWTCGNCGEFLGLSGMGFGAKPTVNGEENAIRTQVLEDGYTLGCPECDYEVTVLFEEQ